MRVMLIDDEKLVLNNLAYILDGFSEVEVVSADENAVEAVKKISELNPDAIFIDINMPILNGLEVAERAYLINPSIKIVFITAYDEYAVDAFRVNAVDYILKPVTTSKMKLTIDRLLKGDNIKSLDKGKHTATKLVAYKNEKIYIVPPYQGIYIMVSQHNTFLYTNSDTYTLKNNLNYWENKLKSNHWFRCHRSFLINIDRVKMIYPMFNSTYSIKMQGTDKDIPVSRTYVNEFKELFGL